MQVIECNECGETLQAAENEELVRILGSAPEGGARHRVRRGGADRARRVRGLRGHGLLSHRAHVALTASATQEQRGGEHRGADHRLVQADGVGDRAGDGVAERHQPDGGEPVERRDAGERPAGDQPAERRLPLGEADRDRDAGERLERGDRGGRAGERDDRRLAARRRRTRALAASIGRRGFQRRPITEPTIVPGAEARGDDRPRARAAELLGRRAPRRARARTAARSGGRRRSAGMKPSIQRRARTSAIPPLSSVQKCGHVLGRVRLARRLAQREQERGADDERRGVDGDRGARAEDDDQRARRPRGRARGRRSGRARSASWPAGARPAGRARA